MRAKKNSFEFFGGHPDKIPNGENGTESLTRRECTLIACNVGAYCRQSNTMSLDAGEALLKRSPKCKTARMVSSVAWAYKSTEWNFSFNYLRPILKRTNLEEYDKLFSDWKREEVVDLREDFRAALAAHDVDCVVYSEPRCRPFVWPMVWTEQDKSTLFVRSPLGSGKSTQMRAMIDKLDATDRVVILSFRVSFTLELQSTLQVFQRYDTISTDEMRHAQRLIVQIDSLHRLGGSKLPTYDVLLVDESESIFKQLLSTEMKHDVRAPNTAILTALLNNTPRALFLDGNMSSRTIELALRYRDASGAAAQMNTYKARADTTMRYSFSRPVVDHELKKDLDAGHKVFIASSSKKSVKRLADWIKQAYPTKRVEVITSEAEQKRKVEFGLNYKTIIPTLDVLIVSPTITAGISFDDPTYFHRRYGYYDADHSKINHLTAVHQQYRVRDVASNDSIICFGGAAPVPYKVAHLPTDVTGLRAALLDRQITKKIERQLAFEFDDGGNKLYKEDLHFHSYLRKERLDTIARNNFAGNYLLLEKQAGCTITALDVAWDEAAKTDRKKLTADIEH